VFNFPAELAMISAIPLNILLIAAVTKILSYHMMQELMALV